MAWYWEVTGETTMDVWDHEGEKVATDTPIAYGEDGDPVGRWRDYPDRVKDIAHEHMEGNQPSAYNQQLIADMSCGQIERGEPP